MLLEPLSDLLSECLFSHVFHFYSAHSAIMVMVCVKCFALLSEDTHSSIHKGMPKLVEVTIFSHSQTFIHSDGEPVTTEREKKLWVGDSLQTWWDNEVWPGAPRLAVRIFHCATNATWQLAQSFVSIWDAPPANVPPKTPLSLLATNTWPTVCGIIIIIIIIVQTIVLAPL